MARLTLVSANEQLEQLGYAEFSYRFEKHFSGRGYCLVDEQGFIVEHESTLRATVEAGMVWLSNFGLTGQSCELPSVAEGTELTLNDANEQLDELGYVSLGYRFEQLDGRFMLVNSHLEVVVTHRELGSCVEQGLAWLDKTYRPVVTQATVPVPEAYQVREAPLVAAINHLPTLLSQAYTGYQLAVEFVTPLVFLVALMVNDAQVLVATWLEYYNEPEAILVEPLDRYGLVQRSHLDVYYDTLSDIVTPVTCKLLELRLRLSYLLSNT